MSCEKTMEGNFRIINEKGIESTTSLGNEYWGDKPLK
jgi:hypothetical protein